MSMCTYMYTCLTFSNSMYVSHHPENPFILPECSTYPHAEASAKMPMSGHRPTPESWATVIKQRNKAYDLEDV